MRLLSATLVVLLLGCSKQPASAASAASASPAAPAEAPAPKKLAVAEPDCTLETPLVPGVPGSPGHLIPSERNPNGDSELAAVMRRMQKDLEAARALVEKGEVPAPMLAAHRRIRCSWPTDLKDRDQIFDGFAITYLEKVKALDGPGDKKAAFGGVLAACKACHERACPGPIAAIEKLQLP